MNLHGNKSINVVLSGGGIKGIAYIGVFEVMEEMGYIPVHMAGVSAGALAGAFLAAGYNTGELRRIMNEFDFNKLDISKIPTRVPVVSRFFEYNRSMMTSREKIRHYLRNVDQAAHVRSDIEFDIDSMAGYRGSILKNLITLSKEGFLYDGDLLEDWVYTVLARRGIKTFGDLKGGVKSQSNPQGYKIRMSAVDVNQGKIIVLPDDISYYGFEPDRLEVAKAVRMSTAIPFVFKAVEIKKTDKKTQTPHYIVDGGVFDNFPIWMVTSLTGIPKIGFRLHGGENNFFSLNTPLKVLKALIAAVHDIGIPYFPLDKGCVVNIDVSKVSTLDFGLDENEKKYLYNAGKNAAQKFFKKFGFCMENKKRCFIQRFLGIK
ncbi:MAG TPA: patatin [Clostridiaceae bacterium]|nr:patatin [Clostridiaceae bacterium]